MLPSPPPKPLLPAERHVSHPCVCLCCTLAHATTSEASMHRLRCHEHQHRTAESPGSLTCCVALGAPRRLPRPSMRRAEGCPAPREVCLAKPRAHPGPQVACFGPWPRASGCAPHVQQRQCCAIANLVRETSGARWRARGELSGAHSTAVDGARQAQNEGV